jgi:hypothetical protein
MEHKHYIITDDNGRIMTGWSDGPCPGKSTDGAITLTDAGDYQFRLFPQGEENPRLLDADGISLYKWDGSAAARRTEKEIEADRAALPEPEEPIGDDSVWDELDTAYREGVDGV